MERRGRSHSSYIWTSYKSGVAGRHEDLRYLVDSLDLLEVLRKKSTKLGCNLGVSEVYLHIPCSQKKSTHSYTLLWIMYLIWPFSSTDSSWDRYYFSWDSLISWFCEWRDWAFNRSGIIYTPIHKISWWQNKGLNCPLSPQPKSSPDPSSSQISFKQRLGVCQAGVVGKGISSGCERWNWMMVPLLPNLCLEETLNPWLNWNL